MFCGVLIDHFTMCRLISSILRGLGFIDFTIWKINTLDILFFHKGKLTRIKMLHFLHKSHASNRKNGTQIGGGIYFLFC